MDNPDSAGCSQWCERGSYAFPTSAVATRLRLYGNTTTSRGEASDAPSGATKRGAASSASVWLQMLARLVSHKPTVVAVGSIWQHLAASESDCPQVVTGVQSDGTRCGRAVAAGRVPRTTGTKSAVRKSRPASAECKPSETFTAELRITTFLPLMRPSPHTSRQQSSLIQEFHGAQSLRQVNCMPAPHSCIPPSPRTVIVNCRYPEL